MRLFIEAFMPVYMEVERFDVVREHSLAFQDWNENDDSIQVMEILTKVLTNP